MLGSVILLLCRSRQTDTRLAIAPLNQPRTVKRSVRVAPAVHIVPALIFQSFIHYLLCQLARYLTDREILADKLHIEHIPVCLLYTSKNVETGVEFEDSYDKLMIATGASSVIPPIKNIQLKNVSTLKSMSDGIKVKELLNKEENKNVVIIGGGFIGLEAVEAAKKLGKKVTVFQSGSRILEQVFDKEITDILEEEIRKHNVDLRLEELALELVGETKVEKVITNTGRCV